MRAAVITLLSAVVATARAAEDAPPVTGNPASVSYKATLPERPFSQVDGLEGNIRGSVVAKAAPDGVGVEFTVMFENLPKTGGPFQYHIHVDQVPSDGNCTQTRGHLDPYGHGGPACDPEAPQACEVGDMSGKHGKITSSPFNEAYVDKFVSLMAGDAAFMGNRSLVVHLANSTRVTCANFVRVDTATGTACADQPSGASTMVACPSTATAAPAASGSPIGGGVRPTDTVVPVATAALTRASPLVLAVAAAAILFAL